MVRRAFSVGLCVVFGALVPAQVHAEDSPSAGVVVKPTAPKIGFQIQATSATGRWVLRVRNDDDEPVRIVADARLLRLLVRPAGKGYTTCALPATMRGNEPRELVLAPGESYRDEFDPRLFCFGKVIDELGDGASVTGFLGFPVERARAGGVERPPFVVEPSKASSGALPIKQLVSQTTWLGTNEPSTPRASEGSAGDSERLVVEAPKFIDARDLRDVAVSVTVRNAGARALRVRLRADQLGFAITSPQGNVMMCGRPERRRAFVRDFFHDIAPKGRETLSVLLGEVCPRQIFDQPGVYQVRATLRADEQGAAAGRRAVVGDFEAEGVTLLRLQRARVPYYKRGPEVDPNP